jgi:hypothetical protein
MKFTDLKKQATKDLGLDDQELDTEESRSPGLHTKYLDILSIEAFQLKSYAREMKAARGEKFRFFMGFLTQEELEERGLEPFPYKVLKTDVDKYIDSDEGILKLQAKVDFQEEKVSYLQGVLSEIRARQWRVRNIIEWRKFTTGV